MASPNINLPVHIGRLITNAKSMFRLSDISKTDIDPLYVVREITDLLPRLVVVRGDDPISREAQKNATWLFRILVRSTLCVTSVLRHRLTTQAFKWLVGEVERRFNQAIVAAGEMVGVVAAQSVGEPATQMTL